MARAMEQTRFFCALRPYKFSWVRQKRQVVHPACACEKETGNQMELGLFIILPLCPITNWLEKKRQRLQQRVRSKKLQFLIPWEICRTSGCDCGMNAERTHFVYTCFLQARILNEENKTPFPLSGIPQPRRMEEQKSVYLPRNEIQRNHKGTQKCTQRSMNDS